MAQESTHSPQAQFEQLSPTQYKIEVTVPHERLQHKLDEAYSELSKAANIPGFRPGHAPRGILNRHFGKEKIFKETAEELIEDTIWPVLKQKELTVVSRPVIDPREWHEGEEFRYVATVEVLPPVPEIDYENIKVTLPKREVTEEILADELHRLRIRLGKSASITDRPAGDGDIVTVDFEGEVPDVMLESFKGEEPWSSKDKDLVVELGGGKALPGLEDALRGMVLEEIKEFDLDLHDDFQDPRVRGKILKAKARLTSILQPEPVELTDELIKEKFGEDGIETLDQLKERVTNEIEDSWQRIDKGETVDQIESHLSREYDFPLPASMVRAEFADILDRVLSQLKEKGADIEALMKPENERGASIRKRAWFQAERLTRLNILLGETARHEGIKASDEDVANYIMMLAYRRGLKERDIKLLLDDRSFIENTREDILRKQVTNFILSRVAPDRVEMDQYRNMAEAAHREATDHEQAAIERMEDPLAVLEREHEHEHSHPASEAVAQEPASVDRSGHPEEGMIGRETG